MSKRKAVAVNAAWNIVGQTAPILVALLSVPLLIRQLGIERFGFLSLAWVLIGYAGLFDLGLGRAVTRVAAAHLGAGQPDKALQAGRTATLLMLLLGCAIGALLFSTAELLVDRLLKIPPALQAESQLAMQLLAASMPVVLLTTALRGMLEARQEFKRLNLIRMLMGVLSYLAPLLVSVAWPRLEAVVLAVIAMRVIGMLLHLRACRLSWRQRVLQWVRPDRAVLGGLFALGGWMSVSNIVGPLLTYLDRFIVAQSLSIEQVAYYATAYDLIMRTLVLPYAVMAVIFPMLARQDAAPAELGRMYSGSVRLLWITVWPVCFTAVVLAHPILQLWLGRAFADAAAPVLQILSIGVFFNVLAQAPANLVQARGNPKWMALLHVTELPLFVGMLWVVVQRWGIVGAACAWTLRAAVDAAMVFLLAGRRLARMDMRLTWWLTSAAFCAVAAGAAMLAQGTAALLGAWGAGLLLFGFFGWFFMLRAPDREWIAGRIAARRGPRR